jgi:hypothetical protein
MNPYLQADRRQRRARRRTAGAGGWALSLVPIVAGLVAGRLAPAPFFDPGPDVAGGLADIYTRVSILLAAGVALASYQLVVRGPDRGVVDLHPILAEPWFAARLRSVALATLGWLGGAIAFTTPLLPHPAWFLGACVALPLAWLAAVGVGVGLNVAAPAVGLEPSWAWALDAVRGPNPRLQAALLYAPGVALTVAGAGAMAGAFGVSSGLSGRGAATLLTLVPLVLAAAAARFGRAHAGEVARYPAILGEIEGAYAATDAVEEARHVYFDWAVRLVPVGLRRDLLRELRHLWRSQRGWAMGAWALGGLAALDAWGGGTRVGVACLAMVALGGARIAAEEPRWLESWLALGRGRLLAARALAVWLHLQPVALGAVVGVLRGNVVPVAVLEGTAVVFALVAAASGVVLRERALVAYLPLAVLTWGVAA